MIQLRAWVTNTGQLAVPPIPFPATLRYFPTPGDAILTLAPWETALIRQAHESVMRELAAQATICVPYTTLLTDLSQTAGALWAGVERTRKQKIAQAEKLQVEVRPNPFPQYELITRIIRFHQQRRLSPPTRDFVKAVLSVSDVFSIMLDSQHVILHVIMRDTPARAMAMYSCMLDDGAVNNSVRGSLNSFLHWWEVQHYHAAGYRYYDWGGIVLDPQHSAYGVTRFKREFGGFVQQEWHLAILGRWLHPLGNLLRLTRTTAPPSPTPTDR